MDRAKTWAEYWQGGASHSLDGSLPSDYGPELGGWWRRFFAQLPPGVRVIDLCTGSGVLCQLAADVRPDLHLTAIDLIDEPPPWFKRTSAGRSTAFIGGTTIETLPVPDASMDTVVSQYGIEYTHLDRSIAEVLRITSHDASVAFIVHSTDSVPVDLARRDVPALDWFLGSDGPFLPWKAVIAWMVAIVADPASFDGAQRAAADIDRRRFNAVSKQVDAVVATTGSDLPRILMGRLATLTPTLPRLDPVTRQSAIDGLDLEFAGAQLRARELIDCALNEVGAGEFAAKLSAGLRRPCGVEPAIAIGRCWGWRITNTPIFST